MIIVDQLLAILNLWAITIFFFNYSPLVENNK